MTFRDYVFETLRENGDSTTKQIWSSLPPEGRKGTTLEEVQASMQEMVVEGLVVRVGRHWRKAADVKTADEAYRVTVRATANLMAEVNAHLAAHADRQMSDKKNWGLVGDLQHYNDLLLEILGRK